MPTRNGRSLSDFHAKAVNNGNCSRLICKGPVGACDYLNPPSLAPLKGNRPLGPGGLSFGTSNFCRERGPGISRILQAFFTASANHLGPRLSDISNNQCANLDLSDFVVLKGVIW